jgi:serpin B
MRTIERPAGPILARALSGLLAVTLVVAGCGTAATPSAPSSSSPGTITAPTASALSSRTTPPPTPVAAPTATSVASSAGAIVPGVLAVTVSDNLRVRSQPRVADDSSMYAPTLPIGTRLVVAAGPVKASGYTWFRVAPVDLVLQGGADQGWVAVADHDGTPWVALAPDPTPGYELASATLDRAAPDTAAAKAEGAATNAFGIALYRAMLTDPGLGLAGKGVVISPFSIVTALAMARAGANGTTASQMDKVLRVAGWAVLGAGLNSLDQLLRSRDATWKDYADDPQHQLALRTANMAFAQRGFPLNAAFLDRLGRTFGSGAGLVDYEANPEAARQAINGWVKRQTLGRIPELLPKAPPVITTITRLVLVNAVYLKAEWARPFDPTSTVQASFTIPGGAKIKVPTMSLFGGQDVPLATGPGWRATELRYGGPNASAPLAMTLILPDNMASFERTLSTGTLDDVQRSLAAERTRQAKVTGGTNPNVMDCGSYPYEVHLSLPRFGIDTHASLVEPLQALGMRDAFDVVAANFSGMTVADKLHVGDVIHQANIDVDEKGTEAGAATAISMDTGGCTGPIPEVTKTLRLDHPFLFVVRDVQTGAILFMGRVMDPSKRG